LDCHDEDAGYFVTAFDPGSPDVRAVVNPRPDANGIDDTTQFLGGRLISVDITAIATAGAQIDDVAASFAPFMVPSSRPELHYVLDRPGAPERVLIVRAAQYSYKVDDPVQRDIQLQFQAADPVAYDPAVQSETAWAGSSGNVAGRRYDLTYDRVYPAGSAAPSYAWLENDGDVTASPVLKLWGPATGAKVTLTIPSGPGQGNYGAVGLAASYVIAAGHYVLIDTDEKTAFLDGDTTKPVVASLDWNGLMQFGWPRIPARSTVRMAYSGTSTTSATQATATWQNGYLS
jgi:hypothetical protein